MHKRLEDFLAVISTGTGLVLPREVDSPTSKGVGELGIGVLVRELLVEVLVWVAGEIFACRLSETRRTVKSKT